LPTANVFIVQYSKEDRRPGLPDDKICIPKVPVFGIFWKALRWTILVQIIEILRMYFLLIWYMFLVFAYQQLWIVLLLNILTQIMDSCMF
jgi:hypothetical protein